MNRRTQTRCTRKTLRRPERRGTAATEFALVLPVLVAIALGCVDLGRGIHSQIALSNAAREGAMYGSTTGFTEYTQASWEAETRDRVVEELSNNHDFQASDLTVDVTAITTGKDDVQLTVAGTYLFETVVNWPGLPHQIQLRHQVSTQRYR